MSFLNDPQYQLPIAITIFIFFLFARKLFRIIVFSFVSNLVKKTKTTFDDEILHAIEKPTHFLFIVIGLKVALGFIEVHTDFQAFIGHTISSLFVFTIFWAIFNILNPFSNVMLKITSKFGKELSDDITNFIIKSLKFIVISIGFAAIMSEWGYNISGFLASLGLVGMALALAAKDTAANLFGSLVIFSDRPFKIGDWIYTPDVEGVVERIGIRSTRIRTFAQALVTVPNAVLANSAILNWSQMGKRRIKMVLGLTYSTSCEQMDTIVKELREMLQAHEAIHPDTIYIYFTDFNDSSLGIFCYFFTKTTNWGEYMEVREEINLKMMTIVENNGASFAFPSRSLYIETPHNEKQIKTEELI